MTMSRRMRIASIVGASIATLLTAAQAQAACDINLGIKNTGTHEISFWRSQSQVKSRGGTWRFLSHSNWMAPSRYYNLDHNDQIGDLFNAAFGCGKRRYKLTYYCQEGPKAGVRVAEYYPNANGWTELQTLTIAIGTGCN